MNYGKKGLALVCLVSMLAFVPARPAAALVGIFAGNGLTAQLGLYLGIAGLRGLSNADKSGDLVSRGMALGVIFSGIFVLDEEGSPSFHFSALSDAERDQLKLKPSEQDAFNHAIPQIEAIGQTIYGNAQHSLDSGVTHEQVLQEVNRAWTEAGASLSPEAVSALSAVRENLRVQLK